MLDNAVQVNTFLVQYARTLLADIPDARLAEQPQPGVNHPAWILGHLTLVADNVLGRLGGTKVLTADWGPRYGMGSKPSTNRGDYPSKEEMLRAFEERHQQLRQTASSATAQQLAVENPNPRMRENLPTLQQLVAFILTGHVGVHLGQLTTWRRLIGLPPLF